MAPTTTHSEILIGVLDADLRIEMADARLAAIFGQAARPLVGRHVRECVAEEQALRALELLSRRAAVEVVVPGVTPPGRELVGRSAVAPAGNWVMLYERPALRRPLPTASPFVGRAMELLDLERSLAAADASVQYVCGPLGIGKSALLAAFAARCAELGTPHFRIDARSASQPDQTVVDEMMRGLPSDGAVAQLLETARRVPTGRWVLLVDNFDAWQRQGVRLDFGSLLAADCRVIVAARALPDPRWWEGTACAPRVVALGALAPGEALEILSRRCVPPDRAPKVLHAAGGHPLSLVTLSAALPSKVPVIHEGALLSFDLSHVGERDVLEAAALPARITEDILVAVLEDASLAARTYERLVELSTHDPSGVGLRMAPVLRALLGGRLRERNPSRFARIRAKLVDYYGLLLESGTPAYLLPAVDDFLDAFADHPTIQQLFGGSGLSAYALRRAGDNDVEPVARAALALGCPSAAADRIGNRLRRRVGATYVVETGGRIAGLCQTLTSSQEALAEMAVDGGDAEMSAACDVLRRAGTARASEHAKVCLAWLTDEPGSWGNTSRVLYRHLMREYFAVPKAVATLLVLSDPGASLGSVGVLGASVMRSGGVHLLYSDVRGLSARHVLERLLAGDGTRERPLGVTRSDMRARVTPSVVRKALQHLDDPDWLASSALAALRIVETRVGTSAANHEKAEAVQWLLRQAIADIKGGRHAHLQRAAILAAFVERTGKHEQIASDLGLPYGTFRRYVTRGIERVAEAIQAHEEEGASRG